jgi:ABC-type polysaccharide/polyol phosphate export permease
MSLQKYTRKIRRILGLSLVLAKAEFKLRNEGSYLGILWYLLNPILTFGLLLLIFNDRLGGDIKYYPLYLMLGIIMFNFFQSTTIESTKSIINEHHYLIKSMDFPREALILSIVFKNLFSHFFEIILFFVLILFFKINLFYGLYYLPILVLFSIFVYGFSLLLSSLSVYFVDLDNIWNFAVRIVWFGTPIFYTIAGQNKLLVLNFFNPLYYFITIARDLLIYNKMPELWFIFIILGISLFILYLGVIVFKKLKVKFAELV